MDQARVDDDFDAAAQEFEQDEEAECERGEDSGHQMDMGQRYRLHQSLTSRGYQLLYIYHMRSAMFSGALPIVIWLFNSFSWMVVKRSAPAYIC